MAYVTNTKIYGTFLEELIGLIFSSVKILLSVNWYYIYIFIFTKSVYFSYSVLFKLHLPEMKVNCG